MKSITNILHVLLSHKLVRNADPKSRGAADS